MSWVLQIPEDASQKRIVLGKFEQARGLTRELGRRLPDLALGPRVLYGTECRHQAYKRTHFLLSQPDSEHATMALSMPLVHSDQYDDTETFKDFFLSGIQTVPTPRNLQL